MANVLFEMIAVEVLSLDIDNIAPFSRIICVIV